MITTSNLGALMGAPVIGTDDEKIGTVAQLFVDPTTGKPNWMTVHTGLFGTRETFVPLDRASWDNERVHIDLDKDFIKDAPRIDTDGALSEAEEAQLYHYYNKDDERSNEQRDDRQATDTHDDRQSTDTHHDRQATDANHDHQATDPHAGRHVNGSQSDQPPVPVPPATQGANTSASASAPTAGDDSAAPGQVPQPGKVPGTGTRMRKYVVTEVFLDDGNEAPGEGKQ